MNKQDDPLSSAPFAEISEEYSEEVLRSRLGRSLMSWPCPSRTKPKFWQFTARRKERLICAALKELGFTASITPFMRKVFWIEADKGQDFREDAGGAMWRPWAVMLGHRLPSGPIVTHQAHAANLLRKFAP